DKVILSGGSALLPNLANYLSKILNLNVIIGDPWARVSYPTDLKPILDEIGPRLAVAIGLAMREVE
ncbi:pilus assembly protein PilM, partial [Candidatus Falkowbacteria bacterium CG_4_9_14_3_um_filter_38_19]